MCAPAIDSLNTTNIPFERKAVNMKPANLIPEEVFAYRRRLAAVDEQESYSGFSNGIYSGALHG